ncbi:MAG: class I SAM-dependent methyltransferase [Ignavibacteria bacterium]|nr:class I SAM-dependent methyltransferase [Ignavibacteria bacterium]
MDPMTKHAATPVQDIASFYDDLASDYDSMTSYEKRFVQERPFFRVLVERYGIKSALDAGSGSGFHSMLLAQLGVRVTAVDVSAAMLQRAEIHAKELGLKVKTVKARFQELDKVLRRKFDGIFCLGNTLVHILSTKELAKTLRNFAALLNTGGVLFLQILNYDRILTQRDRIQSSKESGDKTFVRFYDYDEKGILFNILTLQRTTGSVKQKLNTVRLRPLLRSELLSRLQDAGFFEIQFFGSISMKPFERKQSRDLVILARKCA